MWTQAKDERAWKLQRRATLEGLANLSDTGVKHFMGKMTGPGDYDLRSFRFRVDDLFNFRKKLRKIWSGDREGMESTILCWLEQAGKSPSWLPLPSKVSGHGRRSWRVYPNPGNFPLALALGVSELESRMAVCGNPECPSPYFLKARKTQRFCDRPACSAYGQREHKRKWWSEHGEEWKQKREMVRKSRARKQRRGGR